MGKPRCNVAVAQGVVTMACRRLLAVPVRAVESPDETLFVSSALQAASVNISVSISVVNDFFHSAMISFALILARVLI
jgi:hypothetical protein